MPFRTSIRQFAVRAFLTLALVACRIQMNEISADPSAFDRQRLRIVERFTNRAPHANHFVGLLGQDQDGCLIGLRSRRRTSRLANLTRGPPTFFAQHDPTYGARKESIAAAGHSNGAQSTDDNPRDPDWDVAGTVSGLIGLGGGIFIVPALIFVFKMSQHTAQGTSLATLLLPIGLLGFWEYYRRGYVDLRIATWLAIGFVAGAYIGARWAQNVPDFALRRLFAASMALIAVRLWFAA